MWRLLLCLFPFFASATELMPWFGRPLEIEARATALLQQFNRIQTKGPGPTKLHNFDQFYTFSGLLPLDVICTEAELTLANTRQRSFGFDNLRLTGRYLLFNDIVGDCLSVTLGGTAIFATRQAVEDISSFHHGTLAFETHLAFGREVPCYDTWYLRWWAVAAYGVANQGRPYLRGNLNWERNFWDCHRVRLFVHSLWGLGRQPLNLKRPFRGYGPIHHGSIDFGFRYSYWVCRFDATVTLEYARRLFARNYPRNTNLFLIRLYYPFGL